MTKKVLIISFLLLLSAISINAQRIQVIDGEGMPIAFVTATTPDGKFIADSICQLGYIYWDADERSRTISFDIGKWNNHVDNTAAEERKTRTIYQVYRTDSVGNSRVDDFVMSQYTNVGHYKRSGMEYFLLEESFATDYAYIDKKEFKQLRKDNKVDKSIEELLRFEKVNKIPPLAPNLQTVIEQLFKKDRNE